MDWLQPYHGGGLPTTFGGLGVGGMNRNLYYPRPYDPSFGSDDCVDVEDHFEIVEQALQMGYINGVQYSMMMSQLGGLGGLGLPSARMTA